MIILDENGPSADSVPTKLDEIVRRNRDRLEIGLATASEIGKVTGEVEGGGAVRAEIGDWCVVALRPRLPQRTTVHALGRLPDRTPWITSPIECLSGDRSILRTGRSLYRLANPSRGEPDIDLVFHVAVAVRQWGLNRALDLGVIEVWY